VLKFEEQIKSLKDSERFLKVQLARVEKESEAKLSKIKKDLEREIKIKRKLISHAPNWESMDQLHLLIRDLRAEN
jgi:hypothetical protein